MLALYRKYRPTSLAQVVAQSAVTTPLSNALKSGKIAHSYLFTGPRGCGKTSVARILAHEINSFPYKIEDSYLDIIEIDAASNTGVDNIRDLREKALVAPSKGKYKVYIIDEVHMLSKSAFNALLKTLEEPPAHVVFILATTDFDKVPVTIVSRSQVFRFRLATPEEITPFLKDISKKEGINITDAALDIVVARGGGSFRDTLSLLDQISTLAEPGTEISEELVVSALGLPLPSKLADLLSAYESGDFTAISAQLKSLLLEGLKPEQIAEAALDSIVHAPSPSLLPLLSSLPSVSAPFPEAKLLLAFLSNSEDDSSQRTGTPKRSLPSSKTSDFAFSSKNNDSKLECSSSLSGSKASELAFLSNSAQTRDGVSESTREGSSVAGATRTATSRTSLLEETSSRSAEALDENRKTKQNPADFLNNLKSLNPAIFQQVEKCRQKLDGTTYHLYPTKKIVKTILDRKSNREVLMSLLPSGTELLIHDIDDLQTDPELKKVADLMGGGEPLSPSDSPF